MRGLGLGWSGFRVLVIRFRRFFVQNHLTIASRQHSKHFNLPRPNIDPSLPRCQCGLRWVFHTHSVVSGAQVYTPTGCLQGPHRHDAELRRLVPVILPKAAPMRENLQQSLVPQQAVEIKPMHFQRPTKSS